MRKLETPDKVIVAAAPTSGTEISTQHATFGPPALVAGEDPAAYEELVARISGAVKPRDFLEEIWVRDVVDLTWDTLRMRRIKARLITIALEEPLSYQLAYKFNQLTHIERMIMNSEARRNAAVHEVHLHRSSLAQALRQASDDVIEAEFEDVQHRAQNEAA
jgi:hypothetical protein